MKKTNLIMKNFIYFLIAVTIFACSGNDDDNNNNEFQGQWSGIFSGDDNGTWTASISSNGQVSGVCYSFIYDEENSLNGTVSSSGEFEATFGTSSSGGGFTGILIGNSGEGVWSDPNSGSGTWSGNKD